MPRFDYGCHNTDEKFADVPRPLGSLSLSPPKLVLRRYFLNISPLFELLAIGSVNRFDNELDETVGIE